MTMLKGDRYSQNPQALPLIPSSQGHQTPPLPGRASLQKKAESLNWRSLSTRWWYLGMRRWMSSGCYRRALLGSHSRSWTARMQAPPQKLRRHGQDSGTGSFGCSLLWCGRLLGPCYNSMIRMGEAIEKEREGYFSPFMLDEARVKFGPDEGWFRLLELGREFDGWGRKWNTGSLSRSENSGWGNKRAKKERKLMHRRRVVVTLAARLPMLWTGQMDRARVRNYLYCELTASTEVLVLFIGTKRVKGSLRKPTPQHFHDAALGRGTGTRADDWWAMGCAAAFSANQYSRHIFGKQSEDWNLIRGACACRVYLGSCW